MLFTRALESGWSRCAASCPEVDDRMRATVLAAILVAAPAAASSAVPPRTPPSYGARKLMAVRTPTPPVIDGNTLGVVPFPGTRQASAGLNWAPRWRGGAWRSLLVGVNSEYSWHYDGRVFNPGAGFYVNGVTRSDWSFTLSGGYDRFDGQLDNTYTLGVTRGVTNRFSRWGLSCTFGTQASRPDFFIEPIFSLRVLPKLDLGFDGQYQDMNGVTQQHVLTFSYQISPTRTAGGRMVLQNGSANVYWFYRLGGKGTNLYFVVGDPNATRFADKIQVKVIYPIGRL